MYIWTTEVQRALLVIESALPCTTDHACCREAEKKKMSRGLTQKRGMIDELLKGSTNGVLIHGDLGRVADMYGQHRPDALLPVLAHCVPMLPVHVRHPSQVTMDQNPICTAFEELVSSSIMPRFCEVVKFLRFGGLAALSEADILGSPQKSAPTGDSRRRALFAAATTPADRVWLV